MSEDEKSKRLVGAILDAKQRKTVCKSAFTKAKNRLLEAIEPDVESDIDKDQVRELKKRLEVCEEECTDIMKRLCLMYRENDDAQNEEKTLDEMETLNTVFSDTHKQVAEKLKAVKEPMNSSTSKSELEKDVWRQLQRVKIPTFAGEKKKYEAWKAAFLACIDKANVSDEYKLLQLKQYTSGEALKTIENLGHSAEAYHAAKERLDRKFGGERRQIALYIEQLESFPKIVNEDAKRIEQFADLVDVTVINMKQSARGHEDLGHGALYHRLLKKLPESMVTRYIRWINENHRAETVETFQHWIVRESEYMTIAQESVSGFGDKSNSNKKKGHQSFMTYTNKGASEKDDRNCKVCSGAHQVWYCDNFKKLSAEDRWKKAKELNLCFKCLKDNHMAKSCKIKRECGVNNCKKTHNRLLHVEPARNMNNDRAETRPTERNTTCHVYKSSNIALRTVPVIVSNGNRKLHINALLDDGSTKTYINSDVAAELGLSGEPESVKVNMLNGKCETFETTPVTFGLESLSGQLKTRIDANTVDKVTGDLEIIDWCKQSSRFEHLKGIEFPQVKSAKRGVDLLIGLDYTDLHFAIFEVKGNPGEPIARLTPLGWSCVGPTSSNQTFHSYHTFMGHTNCSIDKTLTKFWEIEEPSIVKELSPENRKLIEQTEKTLKYENKHYEVSLPWNEKKDNLKSNYNMALKRLQANERKLEKSTIVAEMYQQAIDSYENKGYIKEVTPSEDDSCWYLPHFPVVRLNRETTKVRIVFDAAAKSEGLCLNDAIFTGPTLQGNLVDILIRFRRNNIALVCDIEEMYLRVGVRPQDRQYLRFIVNSRNPKHYEFTCLVFGVNASPFLAQYVSQKHAKDHREQYPLAAETVLSSTYMDDGMDSVETEKTAIELHRQLSELWGLAGMNAKKWLSNSKMVLNNIPIENRASKIDLSKDELPAVKTLGVLWIAEEDRFTFHFTCPDLDVEWSKRLLLKKIATIFDPLGFLMPFTVRSKMILQRLWLEGLEWDDKIGKELKMSVCHWFQELEELKDISIPRCLHEEKEVQDITLHAFCDASEAAYGSVVYTRYMYTDGSVSTGLVAAKSRITPLAAMSIPRLELLAAVLNTRLVDNIRRVLQIDTDKCIYWCDSTNVLVWIRSFSRQFKPFVANRVAEIQEKSNPKQWRHVPGQDNPADLISRGTTVHNLITTDTWWKGPEFLQHGENMWPQTQIQTSTENRQETRRKYLDVPEVDTLYSNSTDNVTTDDWRLDPKRFSRWKRLVRVSAWVLRFIENCRSRKMDRKYGELDADELRDSEETIIRDMQIREMPEYKILKNGGNISRNSKLTPLNPFVDCDGLLRSNGRLRNAEFLSYNNKYPVILPRSSYVTQLIVKHFHDEGKHSGTNYTLAQMSSKYWVIHAREEIREVEKNCMTCRKRKAVPRMQIMAPLPGIRLNMPLRAFAHIAIDYGGPFITVQGRYKKREKRYLCLFTCLATRAVHLEVAYGLDTSSFLNAFFRMVNRRGLPNKVLSDNATNFIGADKELKQLVQEIDTDKVIQTTADKELKQLVQEIDTDKVIQTTADKGVTWVFNPPLAAHWGGVHESMIKAAKRSIYAILHGADVTDEELLTAFTGAEALINSRPLTYQSSNPADWTPITPKQFLFGQAGGVFAPQSVDSTDYHPRQRWRRIQELVRHFWHRWLKEWIPSLNSRQKWYRETKNLSKGDVVIVVNPDVPRGHWPLGRVLEVYPGSDGHIRSARVMVDQKEMTRPITKLCPLEITDSN